MKEYDDLNPECQEMVDDLVNEMVTMTWEDRRSFVGRLVQVVLAVSRLPEGKDTTAREFAGGERAGGERAGGERLTPEAEIVNATIGRVLSVALKMLGERQPVCRDSAMLFALSAEPKDWQKAVDWFNDHPDDWSSFEATLH